MSTRKQPRPADVARWIGQAAAEIDRSRFGGAALREMVRERDNARHMLASWDLDAKGQPRPAYIVPVSK